MTSIHPEQVPNLNCVVLRCSRQSEMYLYLREDLDLDSLPLALLQRLGKLDEVMRLSLGPTRRLARVDVRRVVEALKNTGYFLQMPPGGLVEAPLNQGG
ncbi:MAG: YcgL domain-containing protein [Gammaproteobacteria bacterium]|nr:YcgL domain-containing protein [Gammaproteobacteria bacterium]